MRTLILALLLTAACGEPKCTAPLVETLPGVCHVPGGEAGKGAAGHDAEPFVIVERDAGTRADADSGEPERAGEGGSGGRNGLVVLGGAGASCGSGCAGSTGGAGSFSDSAGRDGVDVRGGSGGAKAVEPSPAGQVALPPIEPICGNAIVESDETCDGECPSCDDGDPCTSDTMTGSKTSCDVKCEHKLVTAAITGDKCCPKEARASADGDCVCRGDNDCGGDEYCSGTRCHLLACSGDGDCADDRYCTSTGHCDLRRAGLCVRDRNCPTGQKCQPGASGFDECQ